MTHQAQVRMLADFSVKRGGAPTMPPFLKILILGLTPVQSQDQDQDHAALKATHVLLLFYCRTMMSMIADCKTVKKNLVV